MHWGSSCTMSASARRPYDPFSSLTHRNSRKPLLTWPQIQARLGAERNGGQVCEFREEWIRGAAVPYKECRHLAISGTPSIQNCKTGHETPFYPGSGPLWIIRSISDGHGGPGSLAAGGHAIKAERRVHRYGVVWGCDVFCQLLVQYPI